MNSPLSKLFAVAAIFFIATGAFADIGSVSLAWDTNPEPDIAGYKVYWGTASGVYGQFDDVSQTTASVSDLTVGVRYYFAVTAYDSGGFGERLLRGSFHNRVAAAAPNSDSNPDGDADANHPTATPTPTTTQPQRQRPDRNSNRYTTPTPTPHADADRNSNPNSHRRLHPTRNADSQRHSHPDANSTPTPTPIAPPVIVIQPKDQTVVVGQSATFSVTATGDNLVYQWKDNQTPIPGATSSTYTTPPATLADDKTIFRVDVSNARRNRHKSYCKMVCERRIESDADPAPFFTDPNAERQRQREKSG